MKIERNLPQQLILSHAPWLAGAGLILCILAAAAAGLALIFAGETAGLLTVAAGIALAALLFALIVKRSQVIFDAATGTVTLQRKTLRGYSRTIHPLRDLSHVALDEIKDTARPVLYLRDGTRCPLVDAHLSGNAPRAAAAAINDWLDRWRHGPDT